MAPVSLAGMHVPDWQTSPALQVSDEVQDVELRLLVESLQAQSNASVSRPHGDVLVRVTLTSRPLGGSNTGRGGGSTLSPRSMG
jgi:hypothetical protein